MSFITCWRIACMVFATTEIWLLLFERHATRSGMTEQGCIENRSSWCCPGACISSIILQLSVKLSMFGIMLLPLAGMISHGSCDTSTNGVSAEGIRRLTEGCARAYSFSILITDRLEPCCKLCVNSNIAVFGCCNRRCGNFCSASLDSVGSTVRLITKRSCACSAHVTGTACVFVGLGWQSG